jgi:hypothetical protein
MAMRYCLRPSPAAGLVSKLLGRARKPRVHINYDMDVDVAGPASNAAAASEEADALHVLLNVQMADGAFGIDDGVLDVFATERARFAKARLELEHAFREAFGDAPARKVSDTAFIVLVLRWAFGGERALWQRAENKAVRWLASTLGKDKAEVEAWLSAQQSRLSIPPVARSPQGR